jgi:Arc/MetJ family transcription regulator
MHIDYAYLYIQYCISERRIEIVRTTLNIDDNLLDQAVQLTGIAEKTQLVRLGLESLIARESAKRLALLGGTEKGLEKIPRRKG